MQGHRWSRFDAKARLPFKMARGTVKRTILQELVSVRNAVARQVAEKIAQCINQADRLTLTFSSWLYVNIRRKPGLNDSEDADKGSVTVRLEG